MSKFLKTISVLVFFSLGYVSLSQCPKGYVLKDSNLVVNGDFSQGNNFFETEYRYDRSLHWSKIYAVPAGMYTIVPNARYTNIGFAECTSPDGTHNPMMSVNGYFKSVDIWAQNVKVKKNTSYVFKYSFSVICCSDGVGTTLGTYLNNNEVEVIDSGRDTCLWVTTTTLWNSKNSETVKLSIKNIELERSGNDFLIDNIEFYECVDPNKKEVKEIKTEKVDADERNYAVFNPEKNIRLYEVLFQPNKETLKATSFDYLDIVVNHLNKIKGVKAEFTVHHGVKSRNAKILSQKRAQSVKNYLVTKGIDDSRIKAVGVGYEFPLSKSTRKEFTQLNERVMLRFFGKE